VAAETIAEMADRGKDISHFSKGEGRMVQTACWKNWTRPQNLNASRQAVTKTLVRQALDQHYLAQSARRSASFPTVNLVAATRESWETSARSVGVRSVTTGPQERKFGLLV